jgi:fumarate reductase subunit D
MMRASHKQPGFVAAIVHRLAGIVLAVFLPIHFWALSGALSGADFLDRFIKVTNTPLIKLAEGGIVVALAIHMALGLRVLAIEFLPGRERTRVAISFCAAAGFAVGVLFLLNAG